jgi:spore germination cell wall hydrolase CwlJ-like protein
MVGLIRAGRLAAAFVLSMAIVPAAQAAPAAASLTSAGTPAGAPLSLAPSSAGRVVGSFQAPPAAPAQPAAALAAAQPAVAAAPAAPLGLSDLVAGFTPVGELDATANCLAKAVYFEARGESLEGQLAVAKVVLNRAASGTYPGDVCAVVTQKAQFSFVRGGRLPRADETSESWRRAVAIADIARKGLARSVPENVLWYHANYVSPVWGKWHTQVARIGTHIFYS